MLLLLLTMLLGAAVFASSRLAGRSRAKDLGYMNAQWLANLRRITYFTLNC